jgi:hypothetical protein
MNNPWYYKINGELYKKPKPCFDGDFVHIKSFTGCFKVHEIKLEYFVVVKNGEKKKIPWDCFICLKGQGTSEETLLKLRLNKLATTIERNIAEQLAINKIVKEELQNLRKTFA